MKSKAFTLLIAALAILLILPFDAAAFGELPNGFADELVVGGIPTPTAIDWLPATENGDLLIAGQDGKLYRWDGSGPAEVVLDLSGTICSGGETGLLGLAVDPRFQAGQRFVYLYYTDKQGGGGCDAGNRANRVSRFTMASNDAIGVDSEAVLIDNIAAPGGNHNGGDLVFGGDGLLYVSVGDGGRDLRTGGTQDDNGNARRLDLLNGKILRITPDGGIPAGNPFTGAGSVPCAATGRVPEGAVQVRAEKKRHNHGRKRKHRKKRRHNGGSPSVCGEIFATGLRNPYRIAFDPDAGGGNPRFFINDVGGGAWEEIDNGVAGADYGWNVREGPCQTGVTQQAQCNPTNRFVDPVFAYTHNGGCGTITGGAFVPDDAGWPAAYRGAYLYADFLCDTLFALRDEQPRGVPQTFATGASATHLAFGPDHALYYTTFDGGGQVRKIVSS